ncbi:MAG: SUMF1/EgtB/PvdO family nonheme iron enzyme, partial [Fibrobacter sp.]|nr:SUMF1/EgtB/PvdO family nonheme iron enzyme [Fibrobacter sp.]
MRVIICPEGMQLIENGKFCIDSYEWPNKKDQLPKVDVSYEEAAQTCAKEGKRLCTSEEWQMACRNQ